MKEDEKKVIRAKVPRHIWRSFRSKAIMEGTTAQAMLVRALEEFLKA